MLIAFVVASEEVANSFCKFLVSLIILSVELLMVLHEVCIQLIILVIASTFVWHYKIFCVNGNTGFRNESRIFYFIHLQNEEAYERKESSSA